MSASQLRVLSYNVRYFGHALKGLLSTRSSKRVIAEGLAALDPLPAVICLQEVEKASLRSRLADRALKVDETVGLVAGGVFAAAFTFDLMGRTTLFAIREKQRKVARGEGGQ